MPDINHRKMKNGNSSAMLVSRLNASSTLASGDAGGTDMAPRQPETVPFFIASR
ncbi:MAG TPA: hypothetical protein VFP92_07085 [Rhodanobacteraceae bacterium]|nr:hypothetical protein [Rhodanobacteraceae bacterium]